MKVSNAQTAAAGKSVAIAHRDHSPPAGVPIKSIGTTLMMAMPGVLTTE